MSGSHPLQPLPWDSAFFDLTIARLAATSIDTRGAREALAEARELGYDCVYALVDTADATSRAALESAGFAAMDERLTLERPLDSALPGAASGLVRPATAADADGLMALARLSHRNTRFYTDRRFPRERCDELYARWIRRDLDTPGTLVLVATDGGQVCGYLTVHHDVGASRVGLVAVAESARGRGFGAALLAEGLRASAARGVATASVVTQGGNPVAVAFYRAAGFAPTTSQTWYHAWPRSS